MGDNVTLITAFGAGFLSFISPCVLPLIPGYLSFVSGVSLEEMRDDAARAARRQVVVSSLAFIVGFSLVFIALGATASVIGKFLFRNEGILNKVAGVLVIVFGLHTMGVFRIPFLETEKRMKAGAKPKSLIGAVMVGMAFGFGWTPCIGPILAGILVLAGRQDTVLEGVLMLAVYSAGLGVPFLLTSIAINTFFAASKRIRRHYHAIELASGALLVGIGLLLFTNQMTVIVRYLTPYLPVF
ncbi:MAG TPA: cytochrome c biogenesis protein CcdA [Vicinamibacterales bacterium]